MKLSLSFKIYEFIEEYGHKVLYIPQNHRYFNPTELVWSQTKRCYDNNID
jgi:transposase